MAPPDDPAPSASLDCLKARTAPTHPGAPPEHLGSLRWPQELASGRRKAEDFSTLNDQVDALETFSDRSQASALARNQLHGGFRKPKVPLDFLASSVKSIK